MLPYVVDLKGHIIVGKRNGNGKGKDALPTPHPTLIGGEDPQVKVAGMLDIRKGKFYNYDNQSGHYKPNVKSMKAADEAFLKIAIHSVFIQSEKESTQMNKTIDLEEAINKIFDCDFDADDYNPDGEMYDYAQHILEQFPWEEIFQCAVSYFKKHSSNLDQVLNFIDLYVGNDFIDRPITKPYEFAALIASKVDFEADWDKGADRIDNFLDCVVNRYVLYYANVKKGCRKNGECIRTT